MQTINNSNDTGSIMSLFGLSKPPCKHLKEYNNSVNHAQLNTQLGGVTSAIERLIFDDDTLTQQDKVNAVLSFTKAIINISALGIEGAHTCYLQGMQCKLTFKNKVLINIEID